MTHYSFLDRESGFLYQVRQGVGGYFGIYRHPMGEQPDVGWKKTKIIPWQTSLEEAEEKLREFGLKNHFFLRPAIPVRFDINPPVRKFSFVFDE